MWINPLFLVLLLVIMILAVLHRAQEVSEKNGDNTGNDSKSEGYIWSKAEHSARTDATHIEEWAWSTAIEVPKNARAYRWTKKLDWKEPKNYFACMKVTEFGFLQWTVCEQTKWSDLLAKEVNWKFTPVIDHQNSTPPMVMVWAAVTADGRSPSYSTTVGSK